MFYYIKQHINTQLKTVGESVSVISKLEEALKEIDNIGTVGMPRMAQVNRLLKETFADCSIEAAKMAISQSTLNKEQIELILSSKGLTGNILETTTAELANATATNAMAATEGTATTATVGFGTAIKGLGASLKALAVAHPILLAITVTLGVIAGAVKIVDALTTSMKKQREAFENAQQDYTDACTKLDELKNKLSETTSRIAELIEKSNNGTITLVEQAELDKLKLTNEELRLMIQNQEEVKKQKAKEASDEAYKTYTRENRMEADDTASKQEQYYQASSDADGFHVGSFLDRASELSDFDYAIKANEQKLEEFQKQNEELQAQLNATSDESLKAQYQHSIDLNNNLISNYTNSNEKLKESAEKMAEETFSDKIEKYEAFKQTLMNSMNSDGTFDNPQYQAMWDDMQKKEMDLYRYTGRSAEWNTVKLDSIIDDKSYQAVVDKLKTTLNEGTLTEDDIKGIDVLNDKLNDTDLILEDGQSAAQLFIKYLNKLKETQDGIGSITSSNFDDPTDMLRDLTDKDRKDTTTNLADLKNEADIIKEIQSELEETGNIGVDSMKKITKQYPEAKAALSDYMQGIISEQELFSQLETIYENDKNQYIQSVVDKSQTDEEFFNAVMTNYPELYNELSSLYGNDVDNWSNMEQAKLEITNKAIKELAGVWSDYFKVVQDANGKLMVQTTGWYDAGMYSADPDEVEAMDEEYNNMYNHFQSIVDGANAAVDEILKINEELTNDPCDKELLDRKQELIKAQQEAINSSISEKDALKDLVQEGYDIFLDKLDEVIQKYKDLMNQQKDAYDYEKSIAEKTKALNALEKQYSAVQGDNSEEGKKNIQQLKDQINTAKDDLKDTEYEKLISDTEKILDQLQSDVKSWFDQRIDEFDVTMQEIIDQSNENASNISQTITSTAENYGYKLSESMSSIWSLNANNITNGINSVLGDFSNKFVEGNNAINKVCGDINAAVQGLC